MMLNMMLMLMLVIMPILMLMLMPMLSDDGNTSYLTWQADRTSNVGASC